MQSSLSLALSFLAIDHLSNVTCQTALRSKHLHVDAQRELDNIEYQDIIVLQEITNDIENEGPNSCSEKLCKLAEKAATKCSKVIISLGTPRNERQ